MVSDKVFCAGAVQGAGSAAAELASALQDGQKAGQQGVIAAAKPAILNREKITDQALADFNAELADLGEEISTMWGIHQPDNSCQVDLKILNPSLRQAL